MKVTVFGGTGYVGSYLIDELLDKGHHPVLLVRPGSRHKVRHREHCTLVDGDIASPDTIRTALAGTDAVIYNIGILREFPSSGVTYEALHFEGARRVMDVAEEVGVRRFLLMSANGVKADGTGYQRTKHMAEQYLKTTALNWTVFRPSVLFGEPRGRMEFATQLYRDIVLTTPGTPVLRGFAAFQCRRVPHVTCLCQGCCHGLRTGPGHAGDYRTDIPTVWSGVLVVERDTEDHCRCSRNHQADASGTGVAAQGPRIGTGSVCIFPNHPRPADDAHGG